eukprot:TRINITY_DN6431_c0_g2_i6.p2 TRINITY_DN6431_c0_g2~~TRINITY_DN6431_c0_g2_i6.p2  ORF type:complete len:109 (-),score=21.26 TRINITY_DN6431_c0_g2_i6:175-501(-)
MNLRTSWDHFFSGIEIQVLTILDTLSREMCPLPFLVSFSTSSMLFTVTGVLDEEGVQEILESCEGVVSFSGEQDLFSVGFDVLSGRDLSVACWAKYFYSCITWFRIFE